MTTPRQLDAVDQPCQLRKTHTPMPIRTQSHHRWPEYLQRRLWGSTRLDERIALCGTDHDSLHAWIAFLLGEQRKPKKNPGLLVTAEAARVVAWFQAEQKKLPGYGAGAYGAGPYGRANNLEWDGIE